MVDKELEEDFLRAYAYFRWVDDVIDASSRSRDEQFTFIKQQKQLIDRLYRNESVSDLTPEEDMLAVLIHNDKKENSGLQSFIRNMFALIEFDVYRRGKTINQEELDRYSDFFARSAMDGILYFIGNDAQYPCTGDRYKTFYGAHIAHLLRDTYEDLDNGFINIPSDYFKEHGIGPEDIESMPYRNWVKTRVEFARQCFAEAKSYLNELDVLRAKIVGYWYISRFESMLDTIERDDYIIRPVYNERRNLNTFLKVFGYGIALSLKHTIVQIPLIKIRKLIHSVDGKPHRILGAHID